MDAPRGGDQLEARLSTGFHLDGFVSTAKNGFGFAFGFPLETTRKGLAPNLRRHTFPYESWGGGGEAQVVWAGF